MLVLTRKLQEKIRIGDHIVITVLRTKGKAVRLGIEAPAEVPVIRGELTFEDATEPEAGQLEPAAMASAGVDENRTGMAAGRLAPPWPAKLGPAPAAQRPSSGKTVDVSLQRVPRQQVAQVLPGLASGGGPLRAMLDRRTLTA